MQTANRYPLSTANGSAIPLEVIKPLGVIRIPFLPTSFRDLLLPVGMKDKILIATSTEDCYINLAAKSPDVVTVIPGIPEVPAIPPTPGQDTPIGQSWLGYDWLGGKGFITVQAVGSPGTPGTPAIPPSTVTTPGAFPVTAIADFVLEPGTVYIPAGSSVAFVANTVNLNVIGGLIAGTVVVQVADTWAALALETQLHRT